MPGFGFEPGTDLVWPRPASADEIRAKQPSYQGRPLSSEMLTLKQIITGLEPEIATFEVPLDYDFVEKNGRLLLLFNALEKEMESAEEGEVQECVRGTNGNCWLTWNTTYDRPGKHLLQAKLICTPEDWRMTEIKGPIEGFITTNLCQFNPEYAQMDSIGATLYAKLAESNAVYSIDLKLPTGEHVKTFTGSTSNGLINLRWDLTDEEGKRCTNQVVDTVYRITLPGSGRSQTLRGP
jgi:hypothetical protein